MTDENSAAKIERLERALAEAERLMADQMTRLEALAITRSELAAVKAENARLQEQIESRNEMHTETIVLDDEIDNDETVGEAPLPTLEELMASLDSIADAEASASHATSTTGIDELIAPEVVFPETFGSRSNCSTTTALPARPNTRLLVLAGASSPIKYPLYKPQTTLGRSSGADIRLRGDHISRVHARIALSEEGAVIEDVASKNGIRINSRPVKRHVLRHGDVLTLGRHHFTFIETP